MRSPRIWALAGLICAAPLLATSPAGAQTAVKPYFHIIVDTSGSMGAAMANSCGQPGTRLNAAKCVLNDLVNTFGDVTFGLAEFNMRCATGPHTYLADCSPNQGAESISPDRARVLVPIAEGNHNDILGFVDFTPTFSNQRAQSCPGTDEPGEILVNDENYGLTPLAGSLYSAQRYYQGNDPVFPTSPIATDPFEGCRPYYVILLTDGAETCAFGTSTGQQANNRAAAAAAATALRTTNVGGTNYDIRTFVIGFGVNEGNVNTEAIAVAGGTNAPGPNAAFYAQSQEALALAFSQIVQSSLLTEVCDNMDNDCDGFIDEGFVKYCDRPNGILTPTLCTNPGDVCNGIDDNCFNGINDEVRNACGTCGPPPTEICNLSDDDCDGFIDEGNVCAGCAPEAEICDGKDNDCDGRFDEGITRPCGTDEGTCVGGMQTCIEQSSMQPSGTWGPCNDVGPQPEVCDNLDNNCDGLVDGFAQPCYTFSTGCTGNATMGYVCEGICQSGSELCTAGGFGTCQGQIGPGTDICNGIDDDCDGDIDEGNPGGGGPCGSACGVGTLECQNGVLVCVGGSGGSDEICNGFDDDCDGMIDEMLPPPIGEACTEMGTLCQPGVLMCVGGVEQCVGGVPPVPEACDCDDNDCDGMIDEAVPDPLCPAGATCLAGPYCLCARPCSDGEFPCPLGFMCVDPAMDNNRFCVPDPCAGVQCDPLGTSGNATVCVDGTCEPICDTVSCGSPLVCRPSDGLCVEDNCNGFPDRCGEDELCLDGTCIEDPCDGVSCNTNQFCRDGNCFDSCAGVECPVGQSCMGGNCTADPCGGVFCPDFQVCDPADGECTQNLCGGRQCPSGQACNPLTGDCEEDPCFGVTCPDGQVCARGECFNPSDLEPPEPPRDHTYVSPGGGGGCAVSSGGGASALLLLLVLVLVLRTREQS